MDEVAVDTATRGALKDDTTFKGLRDVIKKCNKVLEELLLRRERRYTLFFRLPQPLNPRDMERIKAWNRGRMGILMLSEADMHEYVFYTNVGKSMSIVMKVWRVDHKHCHEGIRSVHCV